MARTHVVNPNAPPFPLQHKYNLLLHKKANTPQRSRKVTTMLGLGGFWELCLASHSLCFWQWECTMYYVHVKPMQTELCLHNLALDMRKANMFIRLDKHSGTYLPLFSFFTLSCYGFTYLLFCYRSRRLSKAIIRISLNFSSSSLLSPICKIEFVKFSAPKFLALILLIKHTWTNVKKKKKNLTTLRWELREIKAHPINSTKE